MKTEWKTEKCASQPEEFQRISEDTFIQRRNIHKAAGTEEFPDGGYECESRRISEDVYDALMETLNTPSHEAVTRLLEEQNVILAETQLNAEYMICLQEIAMEE